MKQPIFYECSQNCQKNSKDVFNKRTTNSVCVDVYGDHKNDCHCGYIAFKLQSINCKKKEPIPENCLFDD